MFVALKMQLSEDRAEEGWVTKKSFSSELQFCLLLSQDLAVVTLLFLRQKYSSCVPYKKRVRETGDQHYLGMKRAGGDRKRVCGSGVTLDSHQPSLTMCLVTGFHNVLGGPSVRLLAVPLHFSWR